MTSSRRIGSPLAVFVLVALVASASLPVRAEDPPPAAPAPAAESDTQSVEAQGSAPIFRNDRGAARERAIEQALREAVAMVAGTMVSAVSVTQNAALLEDSVFTQAKGYVKTYKVIKEAARDGAMEVTIKAEVAKSKLGGDIDRVRAMLEQLQYPKVMLLISEVCQGPAIPGGDNKPGGFLTSSIGTVENTFVDAWSSKGYTFVDRQALRGKIENSPVMKVVGAEPTPEQLDAIADLSGAQIIIYGKAIGTGTGPVIAGSNMQSASVNMSLRVLNADTGEIVATENADGRAVHIDPTTACNQAFQQTTRRIADLLVDKVVSAWAGSVRMVNMEIEGVKGMATYAELVSIFRSEMRGIKAVMPRGYQSGVVKLDLKYQGRVSHLASDIEEYAFKDFAVAVASFTTNTIKLTVSAKK